MDNFDLKKYLAEGNLLKENNSDDQLDILFKLSSGAHVGHGEDRLYKLTQAWERWNIENDDKYDDLVDPLFAAVELVQDAGVSGETDEDYEEHRMYIKSADKHLKQFNKDVIKAMKSHTEDKNPLKEFVGKELEDRNEKFFDLVPGMGAAETVEGEMLRAINKIVYRWYNDGDEYHIGYGTETAGPAHSFLVNANHPLKAKLYAMFTRGTDYETTIKAILEEILDYIESRNGEYTKNTLGDMLDYEAEFEDETEDEYDEYDHEDYYDDEDDDDDDDDYVNEEKEVEYYGEDYQEIATSYMKKHHGGRKLGKMNNKTLEVLGQKIVDRKYDGDLSKAYQDIVEEEY